MTVPSGGGCEASGCYPSVEPLSKTRGRGGLCGWPHKSLAERARENETKSVTVPNLGCRCLRAVFVRFCSKKFELIYKSVSGATTQRLPTTRFRVSIPNPFQGLDLKAKHTVSIHKTFLRAGTQDLGDLQVHGEQQQFGSGPDLGYRCLPIVSRSKCFAFLS